MRAICTLAIAIMLMLLFAPLSSAQDDDLNCDDFASQADAQRVLDRDSSDPYRLDGNGDGFACGSRPACRSGSAR